jgi:hypothetical protein
MSSTNRKTVATFALAGLLSGLLIIPLAYLWVPIVFGCEGTLFALGFAVAYLVCRRSLPRADSLQFGLLILVLVLGFPLAVAFGAALALASESFLQGEEVSRSWLADYSPLVMMSLMLLWGSVAAAMFVNTALAVLTAEWNNRIFRLLLLASLGTAVLSFLVYLPAYFSENPLITHYRELALFAVLSPLGNAAMGAVCAMCLLQAGRSTGLSAAAGQRS